MFMACFTVIERSINKVEELATHGWSDGDPPPNERQKNKMISVRGSQIKRDT